MTKNEFQLIEKYVDRNNPKVELNYAYVDFDNKCICATDTKMVIKVHLTDEEITNCKGVFFVHKKLLRTIISMCAKDTDYVFEDNFIKLENNKIYLDTANSDRYKFPDLTNVFSKVYDESFVYDDLFFIDFELTHKNTHISSHTFKPLQEFSEAAKYEISYQPQTAKSVGMAKIDGYKDNQLRYEVIHMGIEYKPLEPTLFD